MLKITIHRGQNQIGGSIIEIASERTKIILDAGAELDEEKPAAPHVEGLFSGTAAYAAVFISHYHGDHLGLCEQVLPEIPVYIGAGAARVTNAARRYLHKPEYDFAAHYEAGRSISVGDLRVTPFVCDHSAFDAYMFHVACGGQSVLYTGDFRAHGRKNFARLLERLPHADALIIEGTTLSREARQPQSEADLENIAAKIMAGSAAPAFILQAATNIDRVVAAFKAARRAGRVLLEDLYMAEIASAAGGNIPNPENFQGVRVFLTSGARYALLDGKYPRAKIGRAGIAKSSFLLCVRPSMKDYLAKLARKISFAGGVLFYSMWDGYQAKADVAEFLQFMRGEGVRVVKLHASGHADAASIRELISAVAPAYIIPVHTENAAWFRRCEGSAVIFEKEFTLA